MPSTGLLVNHARFLDYKSCSVVLSVRKNLGVWLHCSNNIATVLGKYKHSKTFCFWHPCVITTVHLLTWLLGHHLGHNHSQGKEKEEGIVQWVWDIGGKRHSIHERLAFPPKASGYGDCAEANFEGSSYVEFHCSLVNCSCRISYRTWTHWQQLT